MPKKKNLRKITSTLTHKEDVELFDQFEKARKFFPQGRKDALLRAMKFYIEDVERQKSGLTATMRRSVPQEDDD